METHFMRYIEIFTDIEIFLAIMLLRFIYNEHTFEEEEIWRLSQRYDI